MMRVLEWEQFLDEGLPYSGQTAVTVGVFDGVHRGHRALVERIVHCETMLPVIITFRRNHKSSGAFPGAAQKQPGAVSSFRQKAALFEELGVAVTVVAELTDSFRNMTGPEFLGLLRERGRMGFLAVGSNFRCGRCRDTGTEEIRAINAAHNIPTELVRVLTEDGAPISSSRIREAVARGDLSEAAALLGRPFTLDIAAAPVSFRAGNTVAGLHDSGLALPPSGRYKAVLYNAKGGKILAEITINDEKITIPGVCGFEFIEFS